MNSPSRDRMLQAVRILTSAVMDGTATAAQQQELTTLLRDNAAARDEYLKFVDMHAMLATDLLQTTAADTTPQPDMQRPSDRITLKAHRRWLPLAGATLLAACLTLVVAFITTQAPLNAGQTPFATVVQVNDTTWDSDQLQSGDRIGQETIRLTNGFVRLEFDSGVDITLQGPAELQLLAIDKTKLKSGVLAATVPPGAEGFTVDTPTAEIIDLGTSFGIDLGDDGLPSVSVFDGEVEVAVRNATHKHLLSEGQSVRIGTDHEIKEMDFDPQPFEKVWPVASGIAGSSTAFRFVPPWPKRMRFIRSDDHIFVATEGHTVDLDAALSVNISKPGEYLHTNDLTPGELSPGTRVRSYILHFSPTEELGPRRAKRVAGSITFDHRVLGVIVLHQELAASMRRFTPRSVGELHHRRQLDLTDGSNGDRIILSEDRKTVTLDVISPGRTTDLVRVIVDGGGNATADSQGN